VSFLPQTDIVRLTKKVRFSAQRRALDRLGYRYTLAADGEPLVRTEALDGKPAMIRAPRWDRITA
jgi:hypothetical protein